MLTERLKKQSFAKSYLAEALLEYTESSDQVEFKAAIQDVLAVYELQVVSQWLNLSDDLLECYLHGEKELSAESLLNLLHAMHLDVVLSESRKTAVHLAKDKPQTYDTGTSDAS